MGDLRDLGSAFEALEALAYGRRATRRIRREQRLMEDASRNSLPPYRWARRLAARRLRRRVIAASGRLGGASGD